MILFIIIIVIINIYIYIYIYIRIERCFLVQIALLKIGESRSFTKEIHVHHCDAVSRIVSMPVPGAECL